MIRLIALDLDGTLLGPNFRISEADQAAVVAARDRGVQVALNTARWYGLAQRSARRLGLETPLICHNGAHIREPNGGAELLHLQIPTELAREIAALCDEHGFETYCTVDGVTYMRSPHEIDPQRLPDDMRVAATHAEHITAPATGFVIFGEAAVAAIVETFGERYANELALPIGESEGVQPYVSITAAGADKGRALRLLCDHIGVPPEETLAIGDATPDVPMFELAAMGVAMGNAPDTVKAKADAVAPSNAESGVAWAIRRFVLESE